MRAARRCRAGPSGSSAPETFTGVEYGKPHTRARPAYARGRGELAAGLVDEHLLAAGGDEGVTLAVGVLVAGRDASVADSHSDAVHANVGGRYVGEYTSSVTWRSSEHSIWVRRRLGVREGSFRDAQSSPRKSSGRRPVRSGLTAATEARRSFLEKLGGSDAAPLLDMRNGLPASAKPQIRGGEVVHEPSRRPSPPARPGSRRTLMAAH